jgi:hypothetical protein
MSMATAESGEVESSGDLESFEIKEKGHGASYYL